MYYVLLIAVIALAVLALYVAYKKASFALLSDAKPAIRFFPKYQLAFPLDKAIGDAEKPLDALSERMSLIGFALKSTDDQTATYSRGHALGDISINVTKVDVQFALPLGVTVDTKVSYGTLAILDSGDLWTLCTDLQDRISSN